MLPLYEYVLNRSIKNIKFEFQKKCFTADPKERANPEDDVEGVKWFRKAAEQGHVKAQYNLGTMYVEGHGVPDNDVEAYAWFSVAATNGQEDLMGWLPEVKAKLTPEQLAAAEKRAAELTEQINANKAK